MLTYSQYLTYNIIFGVDPGGEALEVRGLDYAEVLVIAQREERIALFGTGAGGEVVILDEARAGGLLEPVRISGGGGAGLIQQSLHLYGIQHGIACGIIAPVITVAQGIGVGVLTLVHISLPHSLTILARIEHLHFVGVHRGCHRSVEIHLDASVLALLGRNYYDTVCRA